MKKKSVTSQPGALLPTGIECLGLLLVAWAALAFFHVPVTEQGQLTFSLALIVGVIVIVFQMIAGYSYVRSKPRIMFNGTVALISALSLIGNFVDQMVHQPVYLVMAVCACFIHVKSACGFPSGTVKDEAAKR